MTLAPADKPFLAIPSLPTNISVKHIARRCLGGRSSTIIAYKTGTAGAPILPAAELLPNTSK